MAIAPGAPAASRTTAMMAAPTNMTAPTRAVKTTVSLLRMGRSLAIAPRPSSYSGAVSESPENTPEPAGALHTESHDPAVPEKYAAFMRTGWGDRELDLPRHPIASWAEGRRARLSEAFPGERLVIPAGTFKVRANDTDYWFRSETAHTYLCGNQTSDAALVVEGGEAT